MFGKLTLEVYGGADITCTINEAITIARRNGHPVEFTFNGIVVTVDDTSNADLIYRDWHRAMAGYINKEVGPHPKPVLSKKEKDNDARIQAESDRKREREQKVRAVKEEDRCARVNARLEGAPDIEISEGKEDDWRQITEKNGSSGIYHYAVRWARLMQVEIATGKTVEEIQESASRDADFEGMSGATFGYAHAALKSCWKYGSQIS